MVLLVLGLALAAPASADPLKDARAAYDQGDYERALAAFTARTEARPDDGGAWFGVGLASNQLQRWPESATANRRAAELGYQPALSRYNEACGWARAGDTAAALAALDTALHLGWADLRFTETDPDLASIRELPQFTALVLDLRTVDLLARIAVRDGVTTPRATLEAAITARCGEGSKASCALVGVDPRDRARVNAALAPQCESGDAVACLGAAWTSLPPWSSGLERRLPADPPRFVEQVQRACDSGLAPGCAELGLAHEVGFPAYPNPRRADELLRGACRAGDLRACVLSAERHDDLDRLRVAADEGSAVAMMALAQQVPAEAEAWNERACAAGAMRGCTALAAVRGALPDGFDGAAGATTSPGEGSAGATSSPAEEAPAAEPSPARGSGALAVVEQACADQDAVACALLARLGAAAGTTPIEEALARLDQACSVLPSACEEATFLRQGAPPIGGYPDPPPTAKEIGRGLFDLQPKLYECAVGAVQRGASERWVDLVMRIDADGVVQGVYVANPPNERYRECVVPLLLGQRLVRATAHPSRATGSIPLFHGAEVRLEVPSGEGGEQLSRIREDAEASWRVPLDACALVNGVRSPGAELRLDLTARRDGSFGGIRLAEEQDHPPNPALVQCVTDWLAQHRVEEPVDIPTPMRATLAFLEPRVPERPPGQEKDEGRLVAVLGAEPPGDPVVVRMLVLAVTRARVSGYGARLGGRSLKSIQQAHLDMAEAVDRMTGGRVRIEPEFRTVSTRLEQAVDSGEGLSRYVVEPDELPLELLSVIEPGQWDSLFVWAPIPRGFPRVHLGTTYYGVTVRGATLSTGVIPSRYEVHSNYGLPAMELPLHEWWHQVEDRSRNLLHLGDSWPPLNHAPMEVGGKRLEPRSWVVPDTVFDWYGHVLSQQPRVFWGDVWQTGTRIAARPGNIAAEAVPIGSDAAASLWALTDTWVDRGRYPAPETSGSDAWLGLAWFEAQPVRTLVVHTDGSDGWTGARVEVLPAGELRSRESLDSDPWTRVDAPVDRDGTTWTFTLPGEAVDAVRLVVDGSGGEVRCREIEVYLD